MRPQNTQIKLSRSFQNSHTHYKIKGSFTCISSKILLETSLKIITVYNLMSRTTFKNSLKAPFYH